MKFKYKNQIIKYNEETNEWFVGNIPVGSLKLAKILINGIHDEIRIESGEKKYFLYVKQIDNEKLRIQGGHRSMRLFHEIWSAQDLCSILYDGIAYQLNKPTSIMYKQIMNELDSRTANSLTTDDWSFIIKNLTFAEKKEFEIMRLHEMIEHVEGMNKIYDWQRELCDEKGSLYCEPNLFFCYSNRFNDDCGVCDNCELFQTEACFHEHYVDSNKIEKWEDWIHLVKNIIFCLKNEIMEK